MKTFNRATYEQYFEDREDDGDDLEETGREVSQQFHGPYQPNYGNQFNIDHLTVSMNPDQLLPGSKLALTSV